MGIFEVIALAFMAAAAATQYVSYKQQSKNAKLQAQYNAQLAQQQAEEARIQQMWELENVRLADEAAAMAKYEREKEAAKKVSTLRTRKGITSSSGVVSVLVDETIDELDYDISKIDYETEIRKAESKATARSIGVTSQGYESEAQGLLYEGSRKSSQANIAAYGSLLEGGSKMAKYYADNN